MRKKKNIASSEAFREYCERLEESPDFHEKIRSGCYRAPELDDPYFEVHLFPFGDGLQHAVLIPKDKVSYSASLN